MTTKAMGFSKTEPKRLARVGVVAAMVLGGLQWSTGVAAAAPVCNNASISINIPPQPMSAILDSTPYPSTITVSGLSGTIADVDVTLNGIAHPFPEDLDVLLVGPDGTNILLMSDTGGNNQSSNLVSGVNITLSDEAAGPIPADSTLVAGTYKPTDDDDDPDEFLGDHSESFPPPAPSPTSNTALSVFDTRSPNGTWSLYLVDDDPGPPTPAPMGILGGWCINITTTGGPAPKPAVADFDGNKTTDISVFRPSAGQWLIRNQPTVFHGTTGDIPVPCDYTGDGKVDAAVYRPSVGGWYINGQAAQFLGLDTDVPVPGDYDGDGDCDIAVFRPAVGGWYRVGATSFLGLSGDIPVPGDYDGNGTTDIAIFRPSVGGWYRVGATNFFGLPGDVPVPGDYDGNGTTDIAIFRPPVGGWYVSGGSTTFLGLSGDVPVPGDYDGNGTTDTAVYRPSFGAWYLPAQSAIFFGTSGDIPLPLPAAIYRALFTP